MPPEGLARCGLVTIVGRANVGKSTLLNRLIGQKLSITSRKPQTTRQRVTGIRTDGRDQFIFVDTPGLQTHAPTALNRSMNREALGALEGVDVIVFVVQGTTWNDADENVLGRLADTDIPVILAVNKVDLIADRKELLPALEAASKRRSFRSIVPVSARHGDNVEALLASIADCLPEREHLYEEDQVSDRSERFFVAELIREKLVRLLGDELPYSTAVIIDEFKEDAGIVNISATIYVARSGQKRIVVGKGGEMLKRVGEQARHDIERFLGRRVFLRTWVKVKDSWSDDTRVLRQLGHDVTE
jgi:GTP-binding protein Era